MDSRCNLLHTLVFHSTHDNHAFSSKTSLFDLSHFCDLSAALIFELISSHRETINVISKLLLTLNFCNIFRASWRNLLFTLISMVFHSRHDNLAFFRLETSLFGLGAALIFELIASAS